LTPLKFRPSANRQGQAERPERRHGDREQEVVALNIKVPVQDEKARKSRSQILTIDLLPNLGPGTLLPITKVIRLD
jgi:hypothetical protein